jgi:signal transduction histidine kinase
VKTRSLSGRIALLLGTATVLFLGAAALLMDHMVDADMSRRFDDNLLSQARTLAALVDTGPGQVIMGGAGRFRSRLLASEAPAAYAIRCAEGSAVYSKPAPRQFPPDWDVQAQRQPTFADFDADGHAQRAVWFSFRADGSDGNDVAGETAATSSVTPDAGATDDCRMVFIQPRAELDEILIAIDGILLVTPVLALLAVLALSPVLVRRGLRPLATLGEKMRNIGPQAPGQRLQATGTRELEPLVRRFNEVLARMDEGVARERQFAGALAHETRTRLAELRALVEVEQRYPSGRPAAELLGEIGSIGGDLENTVSGLLLLTRLDGGIEDLHAVSVDIDHLVARQLERLAGTLQQRRLRVDAAYAAEALVLLADPSLLDIVVGNLLGNAGAYAPDGSVIEVHRDARGLTIGNEAPELDAADVPRLGQRFWRKQHGPGGHAGLGLALAGAAAAAIGMHLDFTLDAQRHLRARVYWDKLPEHSRSGP